MSAMGPSLPSRSERLPRALVIDDDPNFLKLIGTVLGLQRFEGGLLFQESRRV